MRPRIGGLLRAVRFVAALQTGSGPAAEAWQGPKGLSGIRIQPWGSRRGTLLAIHGMSPLAEQDPRWIHALRAFAAAGYLVLSPRFERIAQLRIEADQIDQIAATIATIGEDPACCPDGHLSLFSVSFSGGLCLAAAGRPAARPHAAAVCSLGAWADLDSLIPQLLSHQLDDDYARLIVLANFAETACGAAPGVTDVLFAAARANFEQHAFDLEAALCAPSASSLPEEAPLSRIRAFAKGEGNPETFQADLANHAPDLFDRLEPIRQLGGIRAAITLIHGADDPVIPQEQSRSLHAELLAEGQRSRLLITPLISHGDTALGARALLREAPSLLAAFSGFFRDGEQKVDSLRAAV